MLEQKGSTAFCINEECSVVVSLVEILSIDETMSDLAELDYEVQKNK